MQKIKSGILVFSFITAMFCSLVLGIFIGRKSMPYVTENNPAADISNTSASQEKININTATARELSTLTGIGDALAQRIVDYREENGPFARIEDIQDVPGIGQTRFQRIAEAITVGGNV